MSEKNNYEQEPVQPHLPGIAPDEFNAVLDHPSMRFHIDNNDIESSRAVIKKTLEEIATARRLEVELVNDVPKNGINLSDAQVRRFF